MLEKAFLIRGHEGEKSKGVTHADIGGKDILGKASSQCKAKPESTGNLA
jgi:hypothetical protein